MRILYKNARAKPPRTLHLADIPHQFVATETPGVLACEVTDTNALAIVLAPNNRNLFEVATEQTTPLLTRLAPIVPVAPQAPSDPPPDDPPPDDPPPDDPPPDDAKTDLSDDAATDIGATIAAAQALLSLSFRKLQDQIDTVNDRAVVRQAFDIESSKEDPRSTVLALLDRRLKALA